jgi:hypothetical protein
MDDSIETRLVVSNVLDVSNELQLQQDVDDVLSGMRFTTTFENGSLDSKLFAQVDGPRT